jgi:5-methylcytosine-specific restriction endonuclease McrA
MKSKQPKAVSLNPLKNKRSENYGSNWEIERKKCKQRAGYRCVKCGVKYTRASSYLLEAHHTIELSRGGKTTQANLKSLCKKCHAKQHSHLRHRLKKKPIKSMLIGKTRRPSWSKLP